MDSRHVLIRLASLAMLRALHIWLLASFSASCPLQQLGMKEVPSLGRVLERDFHSSLPGSSQDLCLLLRLIRGDSIVLDGSGPTFGIEDKTVWFLVGLCERDVTKRH